MIDKINLKGNSMIGDALKNIYCNVSKIKLHVMKHVICESQTYFDRYTHFAGYNKIYKGVELNHCFLDVGTYIGHRSIIAFSRIGKYCSIGQDIRIIAGHHPVSECISTHPAFYSADAQAGFSYVKKTLYDEYKFINEDKKFCVIVGNDVWIGSNSIILEGVTIGDGAVIGAGSLITKNVEPFAVYVGNPQKFIKYRFDEEKRKSILDRPWWNESREHLIKVNASRNCIADELS